MKTSNKGQILLDDGTDNPIYKPIRQNAAKLLQALIIQMPQ